MGFAGLQYKLLWQAVSPLIVMLTEEASVFDFGFACTHLKLGAGELESTFVSGRLLL